MKENPATPEQEERDALCPECGHAFKTYVDRIVPDEKDSKMKQEVNCPVCGCGECRVVRSGT